MRERDMFLPSCASLIEKELKSLEIIKAKEVDIKALNDCTFEEYNDYISPELTLDEYKLLKEVLA